MHRLSKELVNSCSLYGSQAARSSRRMITNSIFLSLDPTLGDTGVWLSCFGLPSLLTNRPHCTHHMLLACIFTYETTSSGWLSARLIWVWCSVVLRSYRVPLHPALSGSGRNPVSGQIRKPAKCFFLTCGGRPTGYLLHLPCRTFRFAQQYFCNVRSRY